MNFRIHTVLLMSSLVCVACLTTTQSIHGTKINGVTFLKTSEPYLEKCQSLGTFQGVAASIWGGEVGNQQARVDAIKNARSDGATHFLETEANFTDGGVSGKGYKCP